MPVAVLRSKYAARWERSFVKDHGLQPIRILIYNLFSEFLSFFFFWLLSVLSGESTASPVKFISFSLTSFPLQFLSFGIFCRLAEILMHNFKKVFT